MNKTILTLSVIILISASGLDCVSAENMTGKEVLSENEMKIKTAGEEEERIGENVKSNEKGHYNITFSDGYRGYCINYGKNEAELGDEFTVQDTSKAVNNNNGETIGNYLKVFFTDYYGLANEDKVKTQHYIWALSDDFEGWRVNEDIINDIKNTAKTVPDNGAVLKINDTTNAIFYFEVLESALSTNQNFFAYKIDYETIISNNAGNDTLVKIPEPDDKNTIENITKPKQNENNTNTIKHSKLTENNPEKIKDSSLKTEEKNVSLPDDSENVNLLKYPTGNPWLIIVVVLILAVVAVLHYREE